MVNQGVGNLKEPQGRKVKPKLTFGKDWKIGGKISYQNLQNSGEGEPPKLREKFIYLYMESHIWLRYTFNGNLYLTHSPCREIHLGADDEISRDRMVKCEI